MMFLSVILLILLFVGRAAAKQATFEVVWMPAAEKPGDTKHDYFKGLFAGVMAHLDSMPDHSIRRAIIPTREDVDDCFQVHQGLTYNTDISESLRTTPKYERDALTAIPLMGIHETWRLFDWTDDYDALYSIFYIVTSSSKLKTYTMSDSTLHICNTDVQLQNYLGKYSKVFVFAIVPESEKGEWEQQLETLGMNHKVIAYDESSEYENNPSTLSTLIGDQIEHLYKFYRTTTPAPPPREETFWDKLFRWFSGRPYAGKPGDW